jgi:hypothetical protein
MIRFRVFRKCWLGTSYDWLPYGRGLDAQTNVNHLSSLLAKAITALASALCIVLSLSFLRALRSKDRSMRSYRCSWSLSRCIGHSVRFFYRTFRLFESHFHVFIHGQIPLAKQTNSKFLRQTPVPFLAPNLRRRRMYLDHMFRNLRPQHVISLFPSGLD